MTIGSKIPTKSKEYTTEELEIKKELLKFKDSYIFINTNFKRKSEPIFALAFCESQRNITLDKNNLIFQSDDKIFYIISNVVKLHYIDTKGTIGIWGDIINYAYHHYNGKVYIFDNEGNQINNRVIVENSEVLRLK